MKKVIFPILVLSILFVLAGVLAACGPAPEGIVVKTSPKNKTVPQGGTPDLTGGVVAVNYDDGTSKDVPMTDLEVRGLNASELGTQTLVLVYTEGDKTFSTTIEVTVALAKATRLELSTDKVKTAYFTGDNFDRTGLVVTAYYETGTSAEVTNYELSPTRLTRTTTAITVTYRSARATIPVTVVDRAPASLEVVTPPAKTEYFLGDDFDSAGLTAIVTYNDGTTESFAADALTYTHPKDGSAYDRPYSTKDDVVLVTAKTSLGEVSCEMPLTVKEVVPVRMTATVTEGELSFLDGDPFTFGSDAKVTVHVYYNNDTSEELEATDDLFTSTTDFLSSGQEEVEICFIDHETVVATLPVTVRPVEPKSVTLIARPRKTEYAVGEQVDLTGLTLLVIMNNDTQEQVTWPEESGIEVSPSVVTADTTQITVTYAGFEVVFGVTVSE